MGIFDPQIATAKKLIGKFGEASKILRTTPGTPSDASKPWEPGTPSVSQISVSAVWLDRSVLRAEEVLKEGEAVVIVPASGLTKAPDPTLDSIVRKDGTRYSIVRVLPLDPNGQAIIYELRVKR